MSNAPTKRAEKPGRSTVAKPSARPTAAAVRAAGATRASVARAGTARVARARGAEVQALVPGRERPANTAEKHVRKADYVARDLLRRIVRGELASYSTLPKEDDLAASYGVNRGVVREAVKLLEVHRLVEPVRRRGTVVLPPLRSMSPEVLVALLVPRPGDVDVGALAGFLDVRAKLDVQMSEAAATSRTSEDAAMLRSKVARLATLIDDPPEYVKSVHDLTLSVARVTRNPVYEMLAAFNARVVGELEQSLVTTRPPSQEHVAGLTILVELIAAGDVDGARAAVASFHAWSTPRILASAALASGKPLSVVAGLATASNP